MLLFFKNKNSYLIVFLVLLLIITCKKEEKKIVEINYGSISGVIFNEFGAPLTDVTVLLKTPTELKYTTTKDGKYHFEKIVTGKYEVSVIKNKFIGTTKQITIEKDTNFVHDFILKVGEPSLETYITSPDISSEAISQSLTIASNTGWAVSTDVNWIKLPKITGNNNSAFIFEPTENTSGQSRTAKITVVAGNLVKEIAITQDYTLELINTSLSSPLNDSITLSFNKQIDVRFIQQHFPNCIANIGYKYMDDFTKIRFKYSCAYLGQSYSFSVHVKDNFRTYIKPFSINYFTNKIPINDHVDNPRVFISKDNKFLWFASYEKNTIRKISISDFKIEQTYSFNFKIRNISFNPYNNLIYILTDQPDIYVMDPDNGKIVKHIKVEPLLDQADFGYPLIYPTVLEFTASGIGVLICRSNVSSAQSWKVIDSKRNDIIYYHPQNKKFQSTVDVKVNYNHTKLYLCSDQSGVFSFDPVNNVVKDINSNHGFRDGFVTNRVNNNILAFDAPQYIFNPETNEYKTADAIALGGRGEFSYVDGEEDIVYSINEKTINVVDYKNKRINMSFPVYNTVYHFRPRATTDGKYVILFIGETLYRYSTDTFSLPKAKKTASTKIKAVN